MNPDILNQVKKFPLELRGQLFTIILEKLNDENPKIDPMFNPIVKRALSKPKDTKTERADRFQIDVRRIAVKHGHDPLMIDGFVNYWCDGESNPKCRKMRFEKQKTFDIKRRLATWARNDKKFNPKDSKDLSGVDYGDNF